jgi:hypothetical protein
MVDQPAPRTEKGAPAVAPPSAAPKELPAASRLNVTERRRDLVAAWSHCSRKSPAGAGLVSPR